MSGFAVLVALALSAAVPAFAQDAANMPLVGVLRINTPATNEPIADIASLRRKAALDAARACSALTRLVESNPTVSRAGRPSKVVEISAMVRIREVPSLCRKSRSIIPSGG